MSRELEGYRDNLESILEFTGGVHMMNYTQTSRYTGIKERRALRKRFPFVNGYITAEALARALCGPGTA